MAITDLLILPADTVLAPVAELPESVRNRLDGEEGDYALSRPLLRATSRILDARSAALVAAFWSPRTIVEAVLLFSRERELDPEATLTEAFPLLESLLSAGFLVEAASAEAAGIRPSFAPGDEIGDWCVASAVQVVEDSEIYQARRPAPEAGEQATGEQAEEAVVKVERRPGSGGVLWDREAAALERLALQGGAGSLVPRLLGRGEIGGRRWLAIEWWPGVHAVQAAAELRQLGDRRGLLHLCRSLATAYAALHERGIVHGDVHPRNVLVGADGGVAGIVLVDFGLARWEGQPAELTPPRGGVAFFFEPEYARAVLSGAAEQPAASPAGEQHAVAALLYLLLTGLFYREFSLERHEMLRQISEDPPLPFAERGAEPWPEVEAVLARALRKKPAERFGSMAELARALELVKVPETVAVPALPSPALRALRGRVLARIGPDGTHTLPAPPRASIQYGAAGLALALYRCALLREDPALLAQADAWALRARSEGNEASEEGFFNPSLGITSATVGHGSVYHGPAGPVCAQTLIALAGGDRASWRGGVEALSGSLPAFEDPGKALDLTLGRPGWLLATAMLLQAGRTAWAEEAALLRGLGDRLLADLWRELDAEPPIPHPENRLRNLGMAHGWAGALYASLRWCNAAAMAAVPAISHPSNLERRLTELGGEALRWGRGLRWPWRGDRKGSPGEIVSMPGWCNGSAGFVYLWTLAHRELGDDRWARLAEGAAWNAWEAPEDAADLCCGLAGRAYALLEMHRHAGDASGIGGPQWLERARHLAERAAASIAAAGSPDSLYKGEVGVALLAVELERPEEAAFPFFGDEGWP